MQDEIREFTLADDANQAGCLQLLYVMGDSRRAHLVHSVQPGAGCWSGAGANRLEDLIPSRLGQGAGDARKLPACHSPGSVGCHRFPKVRPIGFQCLASPLSQDQLRACVKLGVASIIGYRALRQNDVPGCLIVAKSVVRALDRRSRTTRRSANVLRQRMDVRLSERRTANGSYSGPEFARAKCGAAECCSLAISLKPVSDHETKLGRGPADCIRNADQPGAIILSEA